MTGRQTMQTDSCTERNRQTDTKKQTDRPYHLEDRQTVSHKRPRQTDREAGNIDRLSHRQTDNIK